MRVKLACALVLLLPYAIAAAQSVTDLIRSPGLPEHIHAKELPADFKAVVIRASGGDSSSAMMDLLWLPMMMSGPGVDSAASQDRYERYDYSQASWTNGQTIKTDHGEFLVTYRMWVNAMFMDRTPGTPDDTLRLTLVRTDSIVQIMPRTDLTRERMSELFPEKATPQQASMGTKTAAMSNMKQLALGMIMYSSDYDDVMPYAQDTKTAFGVMMPYVKNSDLFKSLNPSGGRILMNMAVSGVSSADDGLEPAETPMFYDEKAWPDGTRLVAFMDGHVKSVTAEGWASLDKYFKLKLKRHGRPLPADYWKKVAPTLDVGG